MKTAAHKIFITLFCFIMGLMLFSAAFAAGENEQIYDNSFITGFEPADYEQTINTDHKYALIVLSRQFPEQLTVRLGGTAYYQEGEKGSRILTGVENYIVQTADVVWKCLENYDEDLDTFHFVPTFGEYKFAGSLELPVITVSVLGELQLPPMPLIHEEIFPEIPVSQESFAGKSTPQSSYDGFVEGNLPPVRSQGDYGTCWAFATIAAVEADLIHDKFAGTDIDLSELHLAYFTNHVFEDEKGLNTGDTITINEGVNYLNAGGNAYKATFALFNMLGPVQESTVPYENAAVYSPDLSDGRIGDYQITGFYRYDIKNDRDSVKNAIMLHGAVAASYLNNKSYYSATNNSYYYPEDTDETSHSISVVGWNDEFPRDNFSSGRPEGDGAWLIRNSWGENDYDYSGYFWMSYYDKSLYTYAYGVDAQPGRYDYVYSYDNCPGTAARSVGDGVTATLTFYVDEGEQIQAIGFYSFYANLGLQFTISSGSSSTDMTFATTDPGYYLIPLTNPMTISERSKVTVDYSFTSGNNTYAAYEKGPYGGSNGITYHSDTGSEGMVVDGINTGYDGRIKLFTNEAPLAEAVTVQNESGTDITGQTITTYDAVNQLKAAATPAGAVQKFTWTSSDMNIAAVDASSGKVTFLKGGTVMITATAADGSGKSGSVTLKFIPPLATEVSIKDVSGADITGKTITIKETAYQLNAAAAPADASQNFTWTSSDMNIATVDASTGKVSFLKAGTVTVTAAAADGSGKSASVILNYVPLATAVSIRNAAGTDITGQTITTNDAAYQLNASASPEGAAQNFSWTSSDTGTAAVDGNGKVTFQKAGTATITAAATDGSGKTASVTLNYVPLATAVSIRNAAGTDITGQTVTVSSASYQLKAVVEPSGVSQTVTWSCSDAGIAAVDGSGKATFKKAGTVMFTAASTDGSGVSASVTLTTDIKATKIVIKNSDGKDITGKTTKATKKTYQLNASAEPAAYASQKVTWKSSNTKIATVDSTGKVTFKKAGKVNITATAADGSGVSAAVTVQTDIKAKRVTIRNTKGKAISHKTLRIKTKTVQVKAVAIPAKYAAQKFTWKTSDKTIATVRAGKVTFKKAGTVRITATTKDGSKKSNWVKITYKP